MKRKIGPLAIWALMVLYTLVHWIYIASTQMPFLEAFSYNCGALSILCMVVAIGLSVRPRWVEDYFGGLDQMYQVHRWVGIASVVLFVGHFLTSVLGDDDDEHEGDDDENPALVERSDAHAKTGTVAAADSPGPASPKSPSTNSKEAREEEGDEEEDDEDGVDITGVFSMVGFLALTILSLNRKFSYHRWLKTHLLMHVFFGLATLHVILVFQRGGAIPPTTTPGLLIASMLATGCLSIVYKHTLYPFVCRHHFTLSESNRMGRATELVLTPDKEPLRFEPGQFAFIQIHEKGFKESHPFTISSGNQEEKLRFTIKVLGDYTRRVNDSLQPGAKVRIKGPYGRFMPLRGPKGQVWIAGGVGITPFMSVLRSLPKDHGRSIDLFYCIRRREDALYLEEIEKAVQEQTGVRLHLFVSKDGQRLDASKIDERVDADLSSLAFYYCGPKTLLKALQEQLPKAGVKPGMIHAENFDMR